ncbi:MAG: LysR family transcriptional regulator [Janthinobacterium lividum]
MDRLISMRVFAKVVEQSSFARAGELLALSSAVVTRHVADLESHLGTRLLNRTTRRLSLTETGHAYLERIVRILHDIDEADSIASQQALKPAGTLRLYAAIGFGKEHLAALLPHYAKAYPEVQLDVTLSERSVDLVEEGYDVGILTGMLKFDASLIVRQLGLAEVMICASADYIKTHGAPQTPEEISNHACLNFSNFESLRHHWPLQGANGATNIDIDSKLVSNNGDLLRNCAAAGMGLMIGASYSVADDLRSGRLVRVLPKHHLGRIALMMVYPSRRLVSAKTRSFINFINSQFPDPELDPWCLQRYGPSIAKNPSSLVPGSA